MKSNNILYIVLLAMVFTACRKDRNMAYDGPAVVEFNNPISGVNTKLTGQSIGGASNIGGDENIPVRGDVDSLVVQLVGMQRNEPVAISYEIVPGTAVEGEDFEVLDTRGTVLIPANSSQGAIRFRLLNSATSPTAIRTVSFNLMATDKSDIGISANYKTYAVSIFPMKAFLTKTLTAGDGASRYLASANGEVYTSATGNPVLADIAFDNTTAPTLISPAELSGDGAASETFFSNRVFAPAATLPENLASSWATLQLNAVTSASVAAIPVSGSLAAAAVHSSVEVVENGIYGFVNGNGKKGYIRIRSISGSSITLDIMSQP